MWDFIKLLIASGKVIVFKKLNTLNYLINGLIHLYTNFF